MKPDEVLFKVSKAFASLPKNAATLSRKCGIHVCMPFHDGASPHTRVSSDRRERPLSGESESVGHTDIMVMAPRAMEGH